MVDLAEAFGQRADLLQHRFDLVLVVGRLNHIDGHDQKTSRCDRGLRIVALIEAAARHRHDARLRVRQVDLIGRQRPFGRRRRRLAPGLLARRRDLRLACRHFGFVLGHLARMPFLGPRLHGRARLGDLAQALLAPRQFVGDRHPIGNISLVRSLRLGHEIGDLGLQLRLPPGSSTRGLPACS